MNRCIVGAFRGDGMRIHRGGGRVIAHARRDLGGQVIAAEFRHAFHLRKRCAPASAVVHIAGRVVEATVPTPLMARLRRARSTLLTRLAAVDVSAVVGLTEIDDGRAARATNPHENLDIAHARTTAAALMEVARPCALGHLPPGQRSRATRRLRALFLGLHLSRSRRSLRDPASRCHFSADRSTRRFLRI